MLDRTVHLLPAMLFCLYRFPRRGLLVLWLLGGVVDQISAQNLSNHLTNQLSSQDLTAEAWMEKGKQAEGEQQHGEALACYQNAAEMLENDSAWSEASLAWWRQGNLYRDRIENMDAAIQCYQRVVDIQQAHAPPEKRASNVSYYLNLIGNVFQRKADYRQALSVYAEALRLRELTHGAESEPVAQVLANMAKAHRFLGNLEQSLSIYQRALSIRISAPHPLPVKLASLYSQLGPVYQELGRMEEAEESLLTAEGLFLEAGPRRRVQLQGVWLNLGHLRKAQKQWVQAVQRFHQALSLGKDIWGPKHREVAKAWVGLAEAHASQGQLDSAMYASQEALMALVENYAPQSIGENPIPQRLAADPWIFLALQTKARIHEAMADRDLDPDQSKVALATYLRANDFADIRRSAYWSEGAKEDLANEVYPNYEETIALALDLYTYSKADSFLVQAFQTSERSKAVLMLEQMEREVRMDPDQWAGLQSLEAQLEQLRTRLHDSYDSAGDLQDSLFELQQRHARQLYALEQDLGLDRPSLDPEQLRRDLPDDQTACIEYFLGQHHLYAFVLNKSEMRAFSIFLKDGFSERVAALRKKMARPPGERPSLELLEFAQLAHRIYQEVMWPLEDWLDEREIRRLIVVPDGILWYLPFEALLTNAPPAKATTFGVMPWALRKWEFHYAYAGSFLRRKLRSFDPQRRSILAVAPDFSAPDPAGGLRGDSLIGFAPLFWNRKEVHRIAELFQTDTLTGKEASEDRLREMMGTYRCLHFSTHAVVNDTASQQSFIALGPHSVQADDSLFLHEVARIPLKADMVVLSACETGAGRLVRGEGIMSLARGFAERGCPSTVMSLWRADDRAAHDLMGEFYRELAEGAPRSTALHRAKKHYLETAAGPFAHPYYWAQFVLIGEGGQLELAKSGAGSRGWWLLWLLGGSLGVFWLLSRRARKA